MPIVESSSLGHAIVWKYINKNKCILCICVSSNELCGNPGPSGMFENMLVRSFFGNLFFHPSDIGGRLITLCKLLDCVSWDQASILFLFRESPSMRSTRVVYDKLFRQATMFYKRFLITTSFFRKQGYIYIYTYIYLLSDGMQEVWSFVVFCIWVRMDDLKL